MASRPGTADDDFMDGVPVAINEIDEITNRIDILESSKSETLGSQDLGRVLASFESQLMELNRALSRTASVGVRTLKRECEKTEEEVHGLNSELRIAVGESG